MDGQPKAILAWAIGIGAIAMVLLILSIIFGNLSGNTGIPSSTVNIYVANESSAGSPIGVNSTGYNLSGYNSSWGSITISEIWNSSDYGAGDGGWNISILTANATVSSTGLVTNASNTEWANVSLSYNYSYVYTSLAESDAEAIILNYTESAANTSGQFPTVGTILGVALLILVLLALLIFVITKMGGVSIGGGGENSFGTGGGFGGGSSSKGKGINMSGLVGGKSKSGSGDGFA